MGSQVLPVTTVNASEDGQIKHNLLSGLFNIWKPEDSDDDDEYNIWGIEDTPEELQSRVQDFEEARARASAFSVAARCQQRREQRGKRRQQKCLQNLTINAEFNPQRRKLPVGLECN